MIKSLSHIIISGLLLVSVSGLTINMHYCHGSLIDLALNDAAQSCCGGGMDDAQCDQCQDETISLQPISDYVGTEFTFQHDNTQHITLWFSTSVEVNEAGTKDLHAFRLLHYKKPPGTVEVELPRIQTFLI